MRVPGVGVLYACTLADFEHDCACQSTLIDVCDVHDVWIAFTWCTSACVSVGQDYALVIYTRVRQDLKCDNLCDFHCCEALSSNAAIQHGNILSRY